MAPSPAGTPRPLPGCTGPGQPPPGDRRPWPGPLLTRDLRGLGSVLLRRRPRRPSLTPSIHSGRLMTLGLLSGHRGQATGRLMTWEAGRRPDFAPAGACAAHRDTSDCSSRLRAIFLQCATYHFTESTHYEIVFLPKTYIYILMLSRKSRMIDLLVLETVSGQWVIFLPSVSMSFFIN